MSTFFLVIEGAKDELQRLRDEKTCDVEKVRALGRELDRIGGNPSLLASHRFVDACKAVNIPGSEIPQTVVDLIATLDAVGRIPIILERRLTSAIELLGCWYDIQCAHA